MARIGQLECNSGFYCAFWQIDATWRRGGTMRLNLIHAQLIADTLTRKSLIPEESIFLKVNE
jgi:hypothetical protein